MGAMYETVTNNVNFETGEIVSTEKTVIRKNKKDEYVRFFLSSVASVVDAKLTATEHNVLYALQRFTANNSNLLVYNSKVREMIAEQVNVKPETVRKAVSKLVSVGIVVRDKSLYFLNPIHFGRGDWSEIKQLRKNVETIFDFENLTIQQRETASALYENPEQIIKDLKNASDVTFYADENQKVIEYTEEKDIKTVENKSSTNKKQKLKTIDDLFNARVFTSFDDEINNATQNSEIRDLAYADLGKQEFNEFGILEK